MLRKLFNSIADIAIFLTTKRSDVLKNRTLNTLALNRARTEETMASIVEKERTILPGNHNVHIELKQCYTDQDGVSISRSDICSALINNDPHPKVYIKVDMDCTGFSITVPTKSGPRLRCLDLAMLYFEPPPKKPLQVWIDRRLVLKPPEKNLSFIEELRWELPDLSPAILLKQVCPILRSFTGLKRLSLEVDRFSILSTEIAQCLNELGPVEIKVSSFVVACREEVESFFKCLDLKHSLYYESGKANELEHYLGGYHYFVFEKGVWSERYEPASK